MTPLRQKVITAMRMRGFSPRTHKSYLSAVTDLARFTARSPDALERSDIQAYFEHLVIERQLSAASCRVYFHGSDFYTSRCLARRPLQSTLSCRGVHNASLSCSLVARSGASSRRVTTHGIASCWGCATAADCA
jgi:hypothetical protein